MEIAFSILPDVISFAVKIQLEKKRNNSQNYEQDFINPNNLKSELSEPLEEFLEDAAGSKKILYRFTRA